MAFAQSDGTLRGLAEAVCAQLGNMLAGYNGGDMDGAFVDVVGAVNAVLSSLPFKLPAAFLDAKCLDARPIPGFALERNESDRGAETAYPRAQRRMR